MHTLFSYLNFPVLPKHLEQTILDEKDNVYLKRYEESNAREVYGTKISFVNDPIRIWIQANVISKFPKNFNTNKNFICIHKHDYIEYTGNSWGREYNNARGIVPVHKDFGRHYGLNYLINPGGEDVYTLWYDDDFKELKRIKIEPHRWCILSTKVLHEVQGIESDKDRISIGLNWSPKDPESFDIESDLSEFIS